MASTTKNSFTLKPTAASAAKSAPGGPASPATTIAKAGAARTSRSRSHDAARTRRHRVQIVHEHVRIKIRPEAPALVPRRRLCIDILKRLAPVSFHSQRHRKRQKLFEHFRRFHHPVEAIRFHVCK